MANAPVSIREVAAHAGVSVGTVSNVLNRPDVVAEPTRSRVQAAIKQLGFIRNESARQLRAGRSRTIGLVVLDVANPFFTDVARGVEDEASESGLAVILCNSDDKQAKETHYLELLEEHRVQGILITPVSGAQERLAQLQRRGTPVVLVDSRSPTRGQCSVSVDDVLGGDLAVSHLLAAQHERIAFVGGPLSIRQVADRLEGAIRALERAGISADSLCVIETAALNVSAGQGAGAAIADMPAARRPTAVFCANDLLALGVLQEMTARQIGVPGRASRSSGTTTSSSPPRRRYRCPRCASRGTSSAGPPPSCCWRRPSARSPISTGRWSSSRNWWSASPARRARARRGAPPPAPACQPAAGRLHAGHRSRGVGMRIALFVTCLADTLFPSVGKATVTLLERLGHQVEFPAAQTCCGQMHINTGYQREALPLVRRYVEVFARLRGDRGAVRARASGRSATSTRWSPGGTATTGAGRAGPSAVAARTYELSEFAGRRARA